MSDLNILSEALGETSAKELLRLTSNYDKYILRFKKAINDLLKPYGYEVKLGVAFVKLNEQKQE